MTPGSAVVHLRFLKLFRVHSLNSLVLLPIRTSRVSSVEYFKDLAPVLADQDTSRRRERVQCHNDYETTWVRSPLTTTAQGCRGVDLGEASNHNRTSLQWMK